MVYCSQCFYSRNFHCFNSNCCLYSCWISDFYQNHCWCISRMFLVCIIYSLSEMVSIKWNCNCNWYCLSSRKCWIDFDISNHRFFMWIRMGMIFCILFQCIMPYSMVYNLVLLCSLIIRRKQKNFTKRTSIYYTKSLFEGNKCKLLFSLL